MIIKRLKLNQFRKFSEIELAFQPGFNVLVGENGVGKSSILFALRVLLADVIKSYYGLKDSKPNFEETDVQNGWPYLTADVDFCLDPENQKRNFNYFVQKNIVKSLEGEAGKPRDQSTSIQDVNKFTPFFMFQIGEKNNLTPPLAIFYSSHRSLLETKAPSKSRIAGGRIIAHAEALIDRPLNLKLETDYWRKEQKLEISDKIPARANRSIENAIQTFLDEFRNLRLLSNTLKDTELVIDKSGIDLKINQLSDGERGILAMIMDLTRRLSQANPNSPNPAAEGVAIVLIDELDLHLHPKWQREIVNKLTTTFPRCQFIVTTHSPQIIGEVSSEKIIVLSNKGVIEPPSQSFGMDSSWILRHLMGTSDRNIQTIETLDKVKLQIKEEKYEEALKIIEELRSRVGEFPELAKLQSRIDRIQILGNEENKQDSSAS